MLVIKLILASVIVIASARHLPWEQERHHQGYLLGFDEERHPAFDEEDPFSEPDESYQPGHHARARRQAAGSVTLNSDGGIGLGAKIPLIETEKNKLSAIGSVGLDEHLQAGSRGIGLQLDNVKGHSLSVIKENIPGFGDALTGAGKVNVFHNDNHNVDAHAFVTKNMPTIPNFPNYNTVGGGIDYMYKNKVGGSLGMSSTPFLNRQDYSAMANLNVYRNPTTSVDFSGGFKRMDSPFMNTGWKPNFGLTFSKYF